MGLAACARPAQSLVEGAELLHVRGVRAGLQQHTINELSERVEALQARLATGEAALARDNPPVFQYVQVRRRAVGTGRRRGGEGPCARWGGQGHALVLEGSHEPAADF